MTAFDKAIEEAQRITRIYKHKVYIIVQRKGVYSILKAEHVLPSDATHGAYMNGVAIRK